MMKQLLIFVTLSILACMPAFAQSQYKPYNYNNGNRGYNTNPYGQQQNVSRPTYATYGAAYRNEIGASTTFGEISSADSTTVINLSGSYKNMVTRNAAFGAILTVQSLNGNGTNSTYFGIWGTYSYYFNTNWNTANSIFAEAGIGYADTGLGNQGHAKITTSERQFAWMFMIGKNFPLFDKIRFSPKAGVQQIGSTTLAILIVPVNLTIAF